MRWEFGLSRRLPSMRCHYGTTSDALWWCMLIRPMLTGFHDLQNKTRPSFWVHVLRKPRLTCGCNLQNKTDHTRYTMAKKINTLRHASFGLLHHDYSQYTSLPPHRLRHARAVAWSMWINSAWLRRNSHSLCFIQPEFIRRAGCCTSIREKSMHSRTKKNH